jgi:transposase
MTIVMGLDQHRAQITAEWLDTETGEITRKRISPAHRDGVRQFCEPFRGQELEVGLEATTGWRFVADELAAVGAVVHLAEPAETAARRGTKKRAKSDRADITVHQSDQRRAPGHLSRQGPPALRWALFEASMCAARRCSPDYDYYSQAAERIGSNRARLSVARKILKRSYHLLRELGDEAIAPI